TLTADQKIAQAQKAADEALKTAQKAEKDLAQALEAAREAKKAAEEARKTAEGLKQTADDARTRADKAQQTAAGAKGDADAGGMVRRKNVLGTMMHSMVALAILGVEWVLIGYPLAFGKTHGGWIGWDGNLVGLWNVFVDVDGKPTMMNFSNTNVPIYLHCMYQ